MKKKSTVDCVAPSVASHILCVVDIAIAREFLRFQYARAIGKKIRKRDCASMKCGSAEITWPGYNNDILFYMLNNNKYAMPVENIWILQGMCTII